MRICIDGIGLNNLKGTSLYSYTYEFLENLLETYTQHEYELLWDNTNINPNTKTINNLTLLNLKLNRIKNDYHELEEHIKNDEVNIYHSINNGFSIPSNKSCNYISTVYNLLPLENLTYTDNKYFEKFITSFPNAIDKSDKIIAVSNFIKNQLIEYFNLSEQKITVIYPGCSNKFRKINANLCKYMLKNKYNIAEDFLLYVGNLHPKNNLHVLLKILKEVKKYKYTRDTKLVIVGTTTGKREEYYNKLISLAKHLNIDDSIIFTGTIDYEDMVYFYNSAHCLINLSEYDGFPLSVIESIACSTPVICNNNILFQEITGSKSILVNINDINYIKDIILEVMLNNNFKTTITQNEKEICTKYNWENNIIETMSLYESVIS